MTPILKIAAYVAGAVVLLGAVLWVFRIGPFAQRPSAAETVQAEAASAVKETSKKVNADVDAKTEAAQVAVAKSDDRAARAVAEIRYVERQRPVPAPYPDAAFYAGVCQSILYERDPDCRGHGGR